MGDHRSQAGVFGRLPFDSTVPEVGDHRSQADVVDRLFVDQQSA
jgi:hypothetical protein